MWYKLSSTTVSYTMNTINTMKHVSLMKDNYGIINAHYKLKFGEI